MTTLKRPLTWNRCALYVFLTFIIGGVIAAYRPLWFRPPAVRYTPLFYQAVALLWLVVLVGCLIRRPEGRITMFFLLLLVGLVFSACHLLLIAPSSGWELMDTANVTCAEQALPDRDAVIRYSCTYSVLYRSTTYHFEGPAGWPFVRLVDFTYTGL
jgi:hypothetical protein